MMMKMMMMKKMKKMMMIMMMNPKTTPTSQLVDLYRPAYATNTHQRTRVSPFLLLLLLFLLLLLLLLHFLCSAPYKGVHLLRNTKRWSACRRRHSSIERGEAGRACC